MAKAVTYGGGTWQLAYSGATTTLTDPNTNATASWRRAATRGRAAGVYGYETSDPLKKGYLLSVTSPAGTTQCSMDNRGNAIGVIDPSGKTASSTINKLDQPEREIRGGSVTSLTYDAAGYPKAQDILASADGGAARYFSRDTSSMARVVQRLVERTGTSRDLRRFSEELVAALHSQHPSCKTDPMNSVRSYAQAIKGGEAFAQRVLQEAGEPIRKAALTEATVASVVARELGLRLKDLRSERRHRDASRTRIVAAYLGRAVSALPVSGMARYFGRDESTLVRGVLKLFSPE